MEAYADIAHERALLLSSLTSFPAAGKASFTHDFFVFKNITSLFSCFLLNPSYRAGGGTCIAASDEEKKPIRLQSHVTIGSPVATPFFVIFYTYSSAKPLYKTIATLKRSPEDSSTGIGLA